MISASLDLLPLKRERGEKKREGGGRADIQTATVFYGFSIY